MSARVATAVTLALGLGLAWSGCQESNAFDKEAQSQILRDKEDQAWAAVRDRQPESFKGLVTRDFVILSSWGMQNLDQKIEDINDLSFTLKEFLLSDLRVIFSSTNHAVVTYKATFKFVAGGQEGANAVNCSSVWENHGNHWRAVRHTESAPVKD